MYSHMHLAISAVEQSRTIAVSLNVSMLFNIWHTSDIRTFHEDVTIVSNIHRTELTKFR